MDSTFYHWDISVSIISCVDVYFDLELVIMNVRLNVRLILSLIGSWSWLKVYILCELIIKLDILLFDDKSDENLIGFED